MSLPLISIITASYEHSSWLKLCVASVADQGVELEHIVQDAGSRDGTLDWLPQDPRVRAFVEPDFGMYDALNRGLRRATGEICGCLNCDEQYLPDALKSVGQFFAMHPDVDVVLGHVIMVDATGQYLSHRKVQPPLLGHTWTCHLLTYSCGVFFRRRLLADGKFDFDASYRAGGDGEWMVRLLRAGVRMAALGQFTSVFTHTGKNLGRQAVAQAEWRRLRSTAPAWRRALAPFFILQHRWRRWRDGSYSQSPFSFALYTRSDPEHRVIRHVAQPTFHFPR